MWASIVNRSDTREGNPQVTVVHNAFGKQDSPQFNSKNKNDLHDHSCSPHILFCGTCIRQQGTKQKLHFYFFSVAAYRYIGYFRFLWRKKN